MELDVRHLRALCAIEDTGSLHKAARQLGMTQPALSTQLRRLELFVGGRLFTRERTGCRPTPLGRVLLTRAHPLVDGLRSLVEETRAAAAATAEVPGRLRIGSTASRALPGWLRRLRSNAAFLGAEPTLRVNVSAHALLRLVAEGGLDVAFVHEVEGSPLRMPPGLACRVLVEREPQFVSLASDHPAARRSVVRLSDLAGDRWMVDPTVDGEWDGLLRALRSAGLEPRVLHGDYLTAASLVATGDVVALCQPTSRSRADMAIRPLQGDPVGVRLLLTARNEALLEAVLPDLRAAYGEAAHQAPAYRERLSLVGADASAARTSVPFSDIRPPQEGAIGGAFA
ncbi:LysR family transcriptional regulator [Streptomyces kunmingensis]|uniref:LysR family transcriptional regulator n=1 Tax=Streptomyces kunmingensis TaxID=68225 RepID=A0ABU6CFL4_9ACTN|nr:LysR family transcriptional regulator [Streptomyces kunmingensis]MEB3963494.1 LysR family transcriptional regulator [Streptomyces kunmingensis]